MLFAPVFCLQRNTFQAAIVSDDCQSFAVLNYPLHGISWAGNPFAVVGAGSPISGLSGTAAVGRIAAMQAEQRVIALTPGCSRTQRAGTSCRESLRNAVGDNRVSPMPVTCPEEQVSASAQTVFSRFNSVNSPNCYRSYPVQDGGLIFATVSLNFNFPWLRDNVVTCMIVPFSPVPPENRKWMV